MIKFKVDSTILAPGGLVSTLNGKNTPALLAASRISAWPSDSINKPSVVRRKSLAAFPFYNSKALSMGMPLVKYSAISPDLENRSGGDQQHKNPIRELILISIHLDKPARVTKLPPKIVRRGNKQ